MNPIRSASQTPYTPAAAAAAASSNPTMQRRPEQMIEFLDHFRTEYEALVNENKSFHGLRDEYNRKMEEHANELSALDAAILDLERKHLSMKESYETEIRRLRSQPGSAPAAPPAAPAPPTHGIGSRALPVGPTAAPDSSQIPSYQSGLPGAFAAPPGAAQQSALLPQPAPPGGPPTKFGSRTLPAPQSQAPGRILGIPSLPSASPVAPGLHSVGGAPSAIPALTPASVAASVAMSRSTPNKMHPMGLMQSTSAPTQSDIMSLSHHMKKEPGRAVSGNAPLGGPQSGLGSFGQPGRQTVIPTQAPFTQSQQEDDYVVYQGRSTINSAMKVVLQSSFPHDSVVCCVRYSWDGEYLATGSNKSAQIYEAASGQSVAVFSKDNGGDMGATAPAVTDSYVRAVCFSPDGKWLITGAEDHVVKVWDVRNRTVKHKLIGHDTDIYSVDASPNGHFIISGSGDKKAKLWSLETGKLLSTLGEEFGPTDGITSVNVSPTSQHVAAGSLDKIVRVWDVESGRLVRQFEGHGDSVYSVAFSPDGRMLLSGSLDKTLKLWDLAASQPSSQCRLSFTGHKDFVLSVAFSPNGRWLISGSKDRTVQFWDPRQSSMALQLQGHKNSVISIAHNPRAKSLATGSGDCRARTWTYT